MNNNTNSQTPSDIFGNKFRLSTNNSPFISPMEIRHSPFMNGIDTFPGSVHDPPLFTLEQDENQEHESQKKSQNLELSPCEEQISESWKEPIAPITENNMLEIVLKVVGKQSQKVYEDYELNVQGGDFNRKLFEYLWQKFSKLKKTKEQMVKYCIRKSFKHITNKLRAENRLSYVNMENNQVVSLYFKKYSGGDQSISMPFQGTSIQKTMNTNFLKKIFKCKKYCEDYNDFLKQFPKELANDNRKKIKSMNESIKKVIRTKCFKALDDYKRLPWTYGILGRLEQFACKLREHAPSTSEYQKKNSEKQLDSQEQILNSKNTKKCSTIANRETLEKYSESQSS